MSYTYAIDISYSYVKNVLYVVLHLIYRLYEYDKF